MFWYWRTLAIIFAVLSIKEVYVNFKFISKPSYFCLKLCKTKILILIFFQTSVNISRLMIKTQIPHHCPDWFFISKSFSVDPFKIYHFNLKYSIIRELSRNAKLSFNDTFVTIWFKARTTHACFVKCRYQRVDVGYKAIVSCSYNNKVIYLVIYTKWQIYLLGF